MSGLSAVIDLSGAPAEGRDLDPIAAAAVGRGSRGSVRHVRGPVAMAYLARHDDLVETGDDRPVYLPEQDLHIVADARLDDRARLWSEVAPEGRERDPIPPDCRLILAAWRRWGAECVPHLLGDFAFVLYDGRLRRLFAATDHAGVRPLHFGLAGRRILFGSDTGQVLAHPGVSRTLDERSMGRFLAGRCEEPGRSFFTSVRRLAPGTCMTAAGGVLRMTRWWNPEIRQVVRYRRSEPYAEECREILQRAVRDRLRGAGATVGVYVSGGLDSTSVAATAAALASKEGGPAVVAATVVFPTIPVCDEQSFSGLLETALGIPLRRVPAEGHLLGDPAECHPALDHPMSSWQGAFGAMRREMLREGARVLFTGHEAPYGSLDDNRAGYLRRLLRGQRGVPGEIRAHGRLLGLFGRRAFESFLLKPLLPGAGIELGRRLRGHSPPARYPDWIPPAFAARTDLDESARRSSGGWSLLHRAAPAGSRYLGGAGGAATVLLRRDREEAAAGTEARHPLLDRRFVEFCARLPPEQVLRAGFTKCVLRRAMRGRLPDPIRLRRSKTRFDEYFRLSRQVLARRRPPPLFGDFELVRRGFAGADRLAAAWARFEAGTRFDENLEFALSAEEWLTIYRGRID